MNQNYCSANCCYRQPNCSHCPIGMFDRHPMCLPHFLKAFRLLLLLNLRYCLFR